MEGNTMTDSTQRLKSEIYRAFQIQEHTLSQCQYIDPATNERCNTELSSVCTYTVHQIISALALQAPSNQETNDIAVHNISLFSTLTLLAQKLLCSQHAGAPVVSGVVLRWLPIAAENESLFDLHLDIRSAIPDIHIVLPHVIAGTYTTEMDEAFFCRMLVRRHYMAFQDMACYLAGVDNLHFRGNRINGMDEVLMRRLVLLRLRTSYRSMVLYLSGETDPYFGGLENRTETLMQTVLQRSTTAPPNPPAIPARSSRRNAAPVIDPPARVATPAGNEGEEPEDCMICLNTPSEPMTTCTRCRKSFHQVCMNSAAAAARHDNRRFTCPHCRVIWFDQSIWRHASARTWNDDV